MRIFQSRVEGDSSAISRLPTAEGATITSGKIRNSDAYVMTCRYSAISNHLYRDDVPDKFRIIL